uniref:DNA-directed RNA polymerase subunit n=1 Tax=Tydemania expeditionis TaxID=325645 RepID=A0A0D6E1G6_TYDEX|nr:beta' subunit of RNA polymerase [Tydemania expeditionis]CEO91059.1 beta' subunit of RNA polymerase [Tydemania expeditionis]
MKLPGLQLGLATSQLIRKWAQRQLPNGKKINGQILNPKTVNYQTLKPEKDGLFCERLFGPVNDSTCACGRQPQRGQKFCPRCEVEYISNRVRRYRLGYIQLVTAVAHIWFFKKRPSYFSLFLNLPTKKIEYLFYCTQNISRTIFPKEIQVLNIYQENEEKENTLIFQKEKIINRNTLIFQKKKIINNTESKFWNLEKSKSVDYNYWKSWIFSKKSKRIIKITSNLPKNVLKKSLWRSGGVRDSALYFGFSVLSKMFSWRILSNWFSFIFFLIKSPQKRDFLNRFYPGPPGLVTCWNLKLRLFCFTGVQLIRTWLTQLTQYMCNDGRLLEIQIRLDLLQVGRLKPLSDYDFFHKIQLYRRLKYFRCFRHKQVNPASMILSVFPVLPPDLRPILKLNNNQIAVSDLNKLYQTIILRNKRLARLTLDQNFHCLNSEALQYAQRLLQESVDSLIDNGQKNGTKSLSDLFKGKKGRFRQNLLGKRVDYSARSVIVVGPYLKIYECGLPIEIAYELFQPFLLRALLYTNKAQTVLGAKKLFKQKSQFLLSLLKKIVQSHPILLNRAPTLHRLSIQAFQPKLIDGKAILLHPLVCSAFNADFDGDQMGIHIPLCFEARSEAWKIIWSQNNLFSAATNLPTCLPSQDMILGSSFLTTLNIQKYEFQYINRFLIQSPFTPIKNKIKNLLSEKPLFNLNSISPIILTEVSKKSIWNEFIWCNYNPILVEYQTEENIQKLIEIRLNKQGISQKFRPTFYQQFHLNGIELLRKIRTTYNRLKFYENLF